jgi:hypothetical protein
MNYHEKFNMQQIMPVYIELKTAKNIIEEVISILENYSNILFKKINNNSDVDSDDNNNIKNYKIDLISKIKICLQKQNDLKKLSKTKIFERLTNGIGYKYKIDNFHLVENPEKITIENIDLTLENNIIINKMIFQIFEKNINLNFKNVQNLIAELNIVLMQLDIFLDNIKIDVSHFNLFDNKYLDI